jgi:hypothetical protein
VKFDVLVAVPELVVTAIGPVTAFVGTVAVICVGELTVKVVAATPPNVTDVAPVNAPPVMVTTVPTFPLVGVKLLMHGPEPVDTVKLVVLVAVPSESVTAIGPVVAPVGTVAVICVSELTVNVVAAVPLNVTDDTALGASWNAVPVMMTCEPTGPHVGLKDVIVGAAASAGGIPSSNTVDAATTDTSSVLMPSRFLALLIAPPPSHTLVRLRQRLLPGGPRTHVRVVVLLATLMLLACSRSVVQKSCCGPCVEEVVPGDTQDEVV